MKLNYWLNEPIGITFHGSHDLAHTHLTVYNTWLSTPVTITDTGGTYSQLKYTSENKLPGITECILLSIHPHFIQFKLTPWDKILQGLTGSAEAPGIGLRSLLAFRKLAYNDRLRIRAKKIKGLANELNFWRPKQITKNVYSKNNHSKNMSVSSTPKKIKYWSWFPYIVKTGRAPSSFLAEKIRQKTGFSLFPGQDKFHASWYFIKARESCPTVPGFSCLNHHNNQIEIWVYKKWQSNTGIVNQKNTKMTTQKWEC